MFKIKCHPFVLGLIFSIPVVLAGAVQPQAGDDGDALLADPEVSSGTQTGSVFGNVTGTGHSPEVEEALRNMAGVNFTRGPAGSRRIALTFDDGPSGSTTDKVLDILKENGVVATFFVLGEMIEKHPGSLRRIVGEGHEVGNHSYSHRDMRKLDAPGIEEEIRRTQELIERHGGVSPRIFRPPYGNTGRELREYCRETGMVICKWSVDPRDWKKTVTVDAMKSTIRDETRGGSVIILHDIKKKTVKALPGILRELKKSGFEFILLSRMIADAWQEKTAKMTGAGTPEVSTGSTAITTRQPLRLPLDETEF